MPQTPALQMFALLLLLGLGCGKTDHAKALQESTSTETAGHSPEKLALSAKPKIARAPLPVVPLPVDQGQNHGELVLSVRHGGTGTEDVRGLAIDSDGNFLICGYFKGTGIVGSDRDTKEPSAYVAKLSKVGGKVIWTVPLGGSGTNVAEDIALAPDGGTVVVGSFAGEFKIGDGTLKSKGADDIFIAKLGADGHRLWAKRIGSYDIDAAASVAMDKDGNSYVTGVIRGTVSFGEQEVKSQGNSDIFLTKLTPQGEFVWTKNYGAMGQDFGRDIAVDSSGNLILLTEISTTANFGGEDLNTTGNRDIALVKLSPDGAHIWSKVMGNNFDDIGIEVSIDPADNVLITGSFEDKVTFGGDELVSKGRSDLYVAKFDTNGEHIWSWGFGGKDKDWGNSISTDSFGNAYVTGWFWYELDFGRTKLKSKGKQDIFLVKLSPSGSVLWAKSFGDTSLDKGKVVVATEDGGVATVGAFNNKIDFGAGVLKPTPGPDSKIIKGDIYLSQFAR